ncbi:hypothetical protein [Streptomyces milbemycinicus]|uniref:Uncharacterized protein n=1 Tax=Streptomyces milbemycinicus TaxID=476552 RepID=A0ABW8LHG0_9ACTN
MSSSLIPLLFKLESWRPMVIFIDWDIGNLGWSVSDIDFGNFWTAVGSIVTSAAFVVTAWNTVLQRRQTKKQLELIDRQAELINLQSGGLQWDRADRDRRQAGSVRVYTQIMQGDWDWRDRKYRKWWRTATVENRSDDPIYNIRAHFVPPNVHNPPSRPHPEWEAQKCWTSAEDSDVVKVPIEFLASGQKGYLESDFLDYEELAGLRTLVRFTDSQGVRWERDHQGSLHRRMDKGWLELPCLVSSKRFTPASRARTCRCC